MVHMVLEKQILIPEMPNRAVRLRDDVRMATQDGAALDEETLHELRGPDVRPTGIGPPRDPFARRLPFAAVAAAGQLSAAWPPGPTDLGAYWVSTALLVALVLLVVARRNVQPRTWLVRVGIYVSSVTFLMIATGGASSGLGLLLLVPVAGVALYGKRWESAVLVVLTLVALLSVSLATPHLMAATGRRMILFGAVAAMFSVAIHSLRDLLVASNERTGRLLRREEALNVAARRLATMVDPAAITALGVELAAHIASPPGSEVRRAEYLLIEDGIVLVGDEFDESGTKIAEKGPLDEHPLLSEAVRTGQPVVGPLDPNDVGPTLRAVLTDTAITHGAWVPVCPDGTLHGVLTIATRGLSVPHECVDRCVALGHLMELALSNSAAHQKLEQQATTEERRRIARELHDGLAHELAFIASKAHRPAEDPTASLDLRQLADAAHRALDEARRAITLLSANQPQSLASAVAQTAEDLAERLDLTVHLDLDEDIEIPGDVIENLLRILREAMTNAAKHGASREVTVRLQRRDGIRLIVEDDGCGFDPDAASPSGGFGLLSMKERAESVGGLLSLNSAPSHGTRVEVAVP